MLSPPTTPAALGADRSVRVVAVLARILIAAEREYALGGTGLTAREALAIGGIYAADIEAAARRATRRAPAMAADMAVLPAVFDVGRRLAAEQYAAPPRGEEG